jgi:hypothetical protein
MLRSVQTIRVVLFSLLNDGNGRRESRRGVGRGRGRGDGDGDGLVGRSAASLVDDAGGLELRGEGEDESVEVWRKGRGEGGQDAEMQG